MRPSGKRYLHHCSLRSEKNQRTWDNLIPLMKKVCCQLRHRGNIPLALRQMRSLVHLAENTSLTEAESQSEKFNRPPCKYFLKDTCTKSLCEYWHPPCTQIHLTRHFSLAQCTCLMMYNHTFWLKTSQGSSVCMHASPHPHAIHGERLIVSRYSSVPRFVLSWCVSPSPCSYLPTSTLLLCPEPLLPCGQRQGKHTLRLRQLRSLALWQNSLLTHSRMSVL